MYLIRKAFPQRNCKPGSFTQWISPFKENTTLLWLFQRTEVEEIFLNSNNEAINFDSKAWQRHYKNENYKLISLYEQNISKSDSRVCKLVVHHNQMEFCSRNEGCFNIWKSISTVYHSNSKKEKYDGKKKSTWQN